LPVTIDHSHQAPSNSHDHQSDCCGWMCTAALCAQIAAMVPASPERGINALPADDGPPLWRAFRLDRPPRLSLA
jgi:hypothetical protein